MINPVNEEIFVKEEDQDLKFTKFKLLALLLSIIVLLMLSGKTPF